MDDRQALDLDAMLTPIHEEESRQLVGGVMIWVKRIELARGGGGIWGPDNEVAYGGR